MAISIPSPLVEFILLGPLDDRRQLQDSPILGDVWVEFGRLADKKVEAGKRPEKRLDLLIAPYRGQHAGEVAAQIDAGLKLPDDDDSANIGFLQGLIVAHLTFEEVMRVVAPKTKWWIDKWKKEAEPPTHEVMEYREQNAKDLLTEILKSARAWHSKEGSERVQELASFRRFWALTGLILWADKQTPAPDISNKSDDQILAIVDKAIAEVDEIAQLLDDLAGLMLEDPARKALVFQVSRNRGAVPALNRSIPAVKADAAKTLFKVDCREIGWAVIDSGIDGAHPAFKGEDEKSRVKRSFDFKNFRKIVNLSNSKKLIREKNFKVLMEDKAQLLNPPGEVEGLEALERLAKDAKRGGSVHWELVEKFVEIIPDSLLTKPKTNHGTHVAGIIGASKKAADTAVFRAAEKKAKEKTDAERAAAEKAAAEKAAADKAAAESQTGTEPENAPEKTVEKAVAKAIETAVEKAVEKIVRQENPNFADGMCPDITLYDFRVLGPDIVDAEFAIIAALQFIRYMNDRDNFFTIHGANLSLSIPHDVRNFACGRTPICEEAERLVSSGVVVVAAAGNHGYKSFETKDGSFDSYAAFSITDPGNADNVLTVGATHRYWPHTYGVSFFSSRGPTGDGRLKPDLVAPGERIHAPFPGSPELGGEWGELDGTSMAAPHVSGAAAMLMARYSELVGQPLRIKSILCESATDLARERSFQGHGMLDVLRAFQSI